MGRRKKGQEIIPEEFLAGLEDHIKNAKPFPEFTAYCSSLGITRQYGYLLGEKCPKILDAIKRCAQAKEVSLQYGAATGKIVPSFGIFALKQLGWQDSPAASEGNKSQILDAISRMQDAP